MLSKPFFFIFLSSSIYKVFKLVIFTFVFIICFLLCSIRVMVFSLIHDFLGCCFNFPNVSKFFHCSFVFCLSLYGSNFALPFYYILLFPCLPLVYLLPILIYISSCYVVIILHDNYVMVTVYISSKVRFALLYLYLTSF